MLLVMRMNNYSLRSTGRHEVCVDRFYLFSFSNNDKLELIGNSGHW